MKIQNEQIANLQRQQEAKKKTPVGNQDVFANLLKEKLAGKTETATASVPAKVPLANQLTSAGMLLQPSAEAQFMERLDSLLNQWENYAEKLESSHNSLRDIYSSFQNLAQEVNQAKKDVAPETSSLLRDILNEIEVLAETEKIKINRGDYLL